MFNVERKKGNPMEMAFGKNDEKSSVILKDFRQCKDYMGHTNNV
jgi:hypothetical protein